MAARRSSRNRNTVASGKNLLLQLWDLPARLSFNSSTSSTKSDRDLEEELNFDADDACFQPTLPTDVMLAAIPSGRPSSRHELSRKSSCTDSSDDSRFSVSRESILERERNFRFVRHGSDPLMNDDFYAAQLQLGNFVKMGWLTKQGHFRKSWKSRFFVLFPDGTFAYYKSKGRKKIKGCVRLNDGIVSIQHKDIRKIGKPYVFQIEKGFYRLLCHCCSQFEAELWVSALRSVRVTPAPCFELDLTVNEEKAASNSVTRHMNKIFVTDRAVVELVTVFKASTHAHSFSSINRFINELEEVVIDRHHLELCKDMEIEMLPGNELVRFIRRHVEDRIFIPVQSDAYSSLESQALRNARTKTLKNRKVLALKSQKEFGIPDDLAVVSNWQLIVEIVNSLDCVSLPTHKLEVIVAAGTEIVETIARYHGPLFEVADVAISAIFRYVLTMSSLDDIPLVCLLLQVVYTDHPACQNKTSVVRAFCDAIKWIECYEIGDENYQFDRMTLAASRVVVSISTKEIGIQFTTDGNGRGAIVYSIRKLSQAAMSSAIIPGLSLIAINDEPVVLMPFQEICQRLRTASLPKRLTFMTEFYYYQLLSLDVEMFQYLLCLAGSRGDTDSVAWLQGCNVDINELCSWGKARGKQVFGFKPPSSKGSALHAAVHSGQIETVKHLLKLGANANVRNQKGKTPLHLLRDSLVLSQIVKKLVEAGADIDATDRQGLTPLMTMCMRGSVEGAVALLALGADIHRVAWNNSFSALEFSVQQRDLDLVDLCLSKGANPNALTLDGNTSLHLAASIGESEIILRLLKSGADVNIQNRYGQTPAAGLLAIGPNYVDRDRILLCLEILTCAGCELEKRDMFGRHIFHLANISSDTRMSRLVRKMSFADQPDDSEDHDIFGCSVKDYGHGCTTKTDIGYLIDQKSHDSWNVENKKAYRGSLNTRSFTLDELTEALVHGVTVDLADIMSFTLFFESFSNVNDVLNRINQSAKSKQHARGIIRLIIPMLLFKYQTLTDKSDVLEHVYGIIQRSINLDKEKLIVLVEEYKALYRSFFSLCGSESCLKLYNSTSKMMERMYDTNTEKLKETSAFPTKLHIAVDPVQLAMHCTLVTHAIFCSIPVEDFIPNKNRTPTPQFFCAKRWFQHLSAYVINSVLVQDTPEERAETITFFLLVAEQCATLHNYDTLAAILYGLQSTAVQRLRRTIHCLNAASKKLLNEMQFLSDKGCREMNRLMKETTNPSMPYLGLYLQNFVGLNELPVFDKPGLVNANRLRKMGELVVEILHRKSVPYALDFDEEINKMLHVSLPYDSEESRYNRSLKLEPREAGAAPLSNHSLVPVGDLDIENEVRESIGAEGTFGFRQWIRKQKVVHRNRSRSSAQTTHYEWV